LLISNFNRRIMKLVLDRPLLIFVFLFCIPSVAWCQDDDNSTKNLRANAIRLYLDCRRCDDNYIRQQIDYVNYVRDPKEAQVYVLVTSQSTGSGGNEYTLTFIGQGEYIGMNDTLKFITNPDDTNDFIREGRTKKLALGLMRYVARTEISDELNINHEMGLEQEEVIDRWNYWVFELETRPRFEIEETLREVSFRNSVNIAKITHDWKLEFEYDQSFNRTKYFDDDTTHSWTRNSHSLDNLIVKSINDHWSAGMVFDLSTSTYNNFRFNYMLLPAIEYNIFPYSESTIRQMRLRYSAGYQYNSYNDITIYDKMEDHFFKQSLQAALQVQQRWGSVNLSLEASNFLHDFTKNRLELEGFVRLRIIKGLSLQINGGIARIRDQMSLVKGEASDADILLKLRQLETAYSMDGGIGITYTFGSIYNNIVNPRFGNGGHYRYYR